MVLHSTTGAARAAVTASRRIVRRGKRPARAVGFVLSSGFGGVQVDRRDVRAWGVGSGGGGRWDGLCGCEVMEAGLD